VHPPADAARHCQVEAENLARKATRAQEQFFRQLIDTILGRPRLRIRFEYGFSRSDAHFIELARSLRADLVAFGIDVQSPLDGNEQAVWPGVLRYGPFNVALVPKEFGSDADRLSFPTPE
jgi:hypothetical protein